MAPGEFELYGHRFRWVDEESADYQADPASILLIRMRQPFPADAVTWVSASDGNAPDHGQIGNCQAYLFEGVAGIIFPPDGGYLKIFIRPEAEHSALEFALFRGVLPRILHLRGTTCLHASAVAIAGGVVAFCGPSGTGKSTLAAAMACRGFPLVSDDVLPLRLNPAPNGVEALPGLPELRLCRDTVERIGIAGQVTPPLQGQFKAHWQPRRAPAAPLPLLGIYLLEPTMHGASDLPAALLPVSQPEALISLISNSYWVHASETRALGKDMLCLGAVLRSVAVERLSFEFSEGGLAAVEELITPARRMSVQ
jgi:hypothetical protein